MSAFGGDVWFDALETLNISLLSIYGRGYVAQHCIALIRKNQEELVYRAYITDVLKSLLEHNIGANKPLPRYIDAIYPHDDEDEETGDDVIERIKRNLMGKGD